MDIPIQAVLFLGIIPALLIMFISLKGYDGYYKDKSVFLSFVTGIILGVIVAVVRLIFNPQPFLIVFIVLLAFFEQLIKTMVLNIGRLQFKKETTIYGLSLGLGFGSSFTPFLIIAISQSPQVTLTELSIVVIGSIGFILFHAASGAYIGFGIFSGKVMKYLITVIIIQIPFNVIIDFSRFTSDPYFIYYQAGLIIYGTVFFVYIMKKVTPQILTMTERRKRTKKIKKKKG
jgi:hypothetical protein